MPDQPWPFDLAVGAPVFYVPAPIERRPPAMALLPQVAMPARVRHVHSAKLVDLIVQVPTNNDGTMDEFVRLVPFLEDGDPDPGSPMGRCHASEEFVPRDYTEDHEIAEGRRPPRGMEGASLVDGVWTMPPALDDLPDAPQS